MARIASDSRFGVILLSAWLILYGLSVFFDLGFRKMPEVMGGLAIGAGVLLLLKR